MLVLESGPSTNITTSPTSMLTPGGNQYLQPDYLSPLPTTLDAKRSPLALLAQTCSQIGADPPPPQSKSTSDRNKKDSLHIEGGGKASKSPPADRQSFKPYDAAARRDKEHNKNDNDGRDSKQGFQSPAVSKTSTHNATTPTSTATVSAAGATASVSSSSSSTSETKTTDATKLDSGRTTALDMLQGLPKDIPLGTYRSPTSNLGPFGGLGPYPGLDAAAAAALGFGANPAAFRPYPPFGYSSPASLGLGLPGYPNLNYGRVKPGEHMLPGMPFCRDPYCTGCPSSLLGMSNPAAAAAAAASGGVCPAGCTQCDHQKVPLHHLPPSHPAVSSAAATTPATSTTAATDFSPTSTSQRPYVCNWIAGDTYCGKRFPSSEELLQHLRTHTSLSVPTSDAAASSSFYANHPMLAASSTAAAAAAAALQRTYPTPPLSPLSMARYHPYSKPSGASISALSSPNPLQSLSSSNAFFSMGQLGAGNALSSLSAPSHLSTMGSHNPLASYGATNPLTAHPFAAYYPSSYGLYGPRLGPSVLP